MSSPLRVLHIDDSAGDVRLIQALLSVEGIECDVVRVDTKPRLDVALKRGGFDLIVSDDRLPSLTALDVLRLAHGVCPGVPVIIVSDALEAEDRARMTAAGAAGCVGKHELLMLTALVRQVVHARPRALRADSTLGRQPGLPHAGRAWMRPR
ncbi:response regulator [Candidatus Nitrospira bockiana]